MNKPVIYIPEIKGLACDANGKISFKKMDDYFTSIAKLPSQLKLQANFIPKECGSELIRAVIEMEKFIDDVLGFVVTDVFKKIKSIEEKMKYKLREFLKEIDTFFQKKIVDALLKILGILGIPNPLTIPIPGLQGTSVEIGPGYIETLNPVVGDFFTKEGKVKIKLAIAQRKEEIKKFFGDQGKFDGSLGIESPEHEAEELWQKMLTWMRNLLGDFIGSCINAMIKILTKIPIIGPLIKKLGIFIDPTKPLKEQLKEYWDTQKEKIKKAKDDVISGKAFEDLGQKILQEMIDFILNLPIPLFGTLGTLIGFDLEEIKKKDVIHSLEERLHRLEDKLEETFEKIKRFFQGDFIGKIYDILLKAPDWILQNFPVVKKILKAIKLIINIVRGKVPVCEVISILLKPLFDIGNVILGMIPDCVEVRVTKYGIEPNPEYSPKWAVAA